MKPNFALNLSHDGIGLLRRIDDGWQMHGFVTLEDPDFVEKIGEMRKTASELADGPLATTLILPNSQILYRDVDALGATDERREAVIKLALEGATPYAIDDLVFDWCDAGAGLAQVAVVAKETLQEAEAFAVEHQFNPVSFTASPDAVSFGGAPFLGASDFAKSLPEGAASVEAERQPIKIVDAPAPEDIPEPDDLTADEAEPSGTEEPQTETEAEAEGIAPDTDDLPVNDVPESEESFAPIAEEPAPVAAFSTRRILTPEEAVVVPRLDNIAPRIGFGATGQTHLAAETPPRLGGVNRDAEITPLAVTAAAAPEDDRPAVSSIPPAPAEPEPDTTDVPPSHKPAADANAFTVFGARKDQPVGGKPKFLGLILGACLLMVMLGVAWLFGLGGGNPEVTSTTAPDQVTETPIAATNTDTPANTIVANTVAPNVGDIGGQDGQTIDDLVIAALTEPDIATTDPSVLSDPAVVEEQLGAPSTNLSTFEGAQRFYEKTGVWPLDPIASPDPDIDRIDDLYIASIDRRIYGTDAVALPDVRSLMTFSSPNAQGAPAPAGTEFEFDERGFVTATPEGALTPNGAVVFLGKPQIFPPVRPFTENPAPETSAEPAPNQLAAVRPRPRPGGLIEANQKSRLGGRTLVELGQLRPPPRPQSLQEKQGETSDQPTARAVLSSRSPARRPANFANIVETARTAAPVQDNTVLASVAVAAPRTPSVPTRANVAKEATVANAIKLNRVNLIGVYGSNADRRALVRLSTGRYVKVQVGDRLDGGKVAAISTSELRYVKKGKNILLEMPRG